MTCTVAGAHRAGEGACNSLYCQRRRQISNMADFLLSTVTIFSITILLWLKKAAMFEFCRIRIYMLPRRLDELLTVVSQPHKCQCRATVLDLYPL